MEVAGRELQPGRLRHEAKRHPSRHGSRIRIPDRKVIRKVMDGRTRGYLAMQEVIQPCPRGRV